MYLSYLGPTSYSLGFYTLSPLVRRRQWHPTPVLLPGKSHGWGSLVGCSPWGCWGLDTTEWLHFHFSLSCIGEGNGSPLQYSCLENPRDGGGWWAAIYGVTQIRTWLKCLSRSSPLVTIRSGGWLLPELLTLLHIPLWLLDSQHCSSWVPCGLRNSYLEGQTHGQLWYPCLLIWQKILYFTLSMSSRQRPPGVL